MTFLSPEIIKIIEELNDAKVAVEEKKLELTNLLDAKPGKTI